nr:uroporphyrinogen-III synthase [Cellulosimicrobium arenosum]
MRAAGARVLVSPAIERAAVADTTPVDDAVADLGRGTFAWVVVTSVNAIDELAASAARRGTTPADLARGARWAAVGPATRRALEAVGVAVDLEPEENSARGLVAAFRALAGEHGASPADPDSSAGPGAAARVLVPQGDLAARTMADGLRGLGFEPCVVTVYRTVAHDLSADVVAAWRAGEVDAVVLTSGSVAREIARQLGPRDDVAAVAIGEPTARAARTVGLRLDAVAQRPTDDALAAALGTVLSATAPVRVGPGSDPTGSADPNDGAEPIDSAAPTDGGDPS